MHVFVGTMAMSHTISLFLHWNVTSYIFYAQSLNVITKQNHNAVYTVQIVLPGLHWCDAGNAQDLLHFLASHCGCQINNILKQIAKRSVIAKIASHGCSQVQVRKTRCGRDAVWAIQKAWLKSHHTDFSCDSCVNHMQCPAPHKCELRLKDFTDELPVYCFNLVILFLTPSIHNTNNSMKFYSHQPGPFQLARDSKRDPLPIPS